VFDFPAIIFLHKSGQPVFALLNVHIVTNHISIICGLQFNLSSSTISSFDIQSIDVGLLVVDFFSGYKLSHFSIHLLNFFSYPVEYSEAVN